MIKKKLNLSSFRELGVIAMIVIIYAVVCIIEPRFFSTTSLVNILLFFPFLLIVSLGEMIEIVSRNVDMSLGAILACSGYAAGLLFKMYSGLPIAVVFIAAIALGCVLGLINGFIVTKFQIPSVIVTLGTMNVYRGVIFILGGKQIDNSVIPQSLMALSQPKQSVIGIPYSVLIALLAAVLLALFLKYFRAGREIYEIGCNPAAASLRGISNNRVQLFVFTLAGGLSGLAGMVFISRIGYMDPGAAGRGLEFTAIAAVVIGGTSMNGGVGKVTGTVLGCLLLGVIQNAISITGISGYWQEAIYGIIIVVSVIIDNLIKNSLAVSEAR